MTGAEMTRPPRRASPATPPQEGNGHYTYTDTPQPPRRASPATPPQERNGHYTYTDTPQPPRRASPATPPQEGNGPALYLYRHATTTPPGFARHLSTGGEWSGTILIQTRHNHPAGLRPPPLHRRGIAQCRYDTTTPPGFARHLSTGGELLSADTTQPPRRASPATSPQEGNCSVQIRHNHPAGLRPPPLHRRGIAQCRHATTTPSGFARHPSTGGELLSADTTQPPRRASPATSPQEGNGPALYLYRHATTTPPGFARHPSTGGEWSGTILIQTRHNHPAGLRPPPLHRRGMVRHYTYTDTPQPPRRASPATPPQEGNGPALYLYRHATTTPPGFARHPSAGGEYHFFNSPVTGEHAILLLQFSPIMWQRLIA